MAWLMAPVLWQTKQCFRSQSSPASASHESSVIARCPNIKLLTFPKSFSYVAKHLSSIKLSVGWWIVFAQSPFGCLGLGKLGLQMMGGKTYLWPLCIPRCTTKAFEHTICHRFSDHLGLHFVKIHVILEKNGNQWHRIINIYILSLCNI